MNPIGSNPALKLGASALALILLAALAGCGDGEKSASVEHKAPPVTESEHEKFEKKYAENCVRYEQKDQNAGYTNDQELGRMCACMAKELSQRISKADAVHFLTKNEFPVDMVMMTNAASNICQSKK
jgi:hypothetical protein